MEQNTAALNAEERAALLAPVCGDVCALAVSGGPDSMALAFCAKQTLGADNVFAFIVEHGLRSGSAQEAQAVKERLGAMGLRAEILKWEHEKVSSRVHVKARAARYGLLIEACKAKGIGVLLLAHHKDDQAETVLMRLAKGSGLAGLSGMKREDVREGVRLFRPFLDVPKERLVATCDALGIVYVRDPSNESEKYARGRLRRVTEALASEGFTQDRLLDLAARAGEAAQALDFYAKAFLRAHAKEVYGCAVQMDGAAFAALPDGVGLNVLARILQALNAKTFAPTRAALLRLQAFLREGPGAFSLHGCLVQKSKEDVLFLREPSAIEDVRVAVPGQTILWDGRWRVVCGPEDEGLEIRALGFMPHNVVKSFAPLLRKRIPSGRVRAGMPCLWQANAPVRLPDSSCDFRGLFDDPPS